MPESREITSFEELKKVRLADEGYIVITSGAGHAVIHKVNSKCISADNFNAKVSLNKRTQGSYFWVDTVATAAREFAAKRRKTCKPEVLLVPPSTFES